MVRIRSLSQWGILLGWAAARCGDIALADEPPAPPSPGAIQLVVDLELPPAPAPSPPSVFPTPATQASPMPVPVPVKEVESSVALPAPSVSAMGSGRPNQKTVSLEVIRERYPNKKTAIERHVSRDAKQNYVNHGTWTMWDTQERMICQGEFLEGKAAGVWTRWFHDGEDDSYSGGDYAEFARPFKATATYVDDKLVGVWSLLDSDGKLIHTWEFDQDKLNGKATSYYASGKVRIEAGYRNGLLDGEMLEFDQNGAKLESQNWQAGRRLGPTTQRYPSGKKYSEGEYFYAREDKPATYDFFKGVISVDQLPSKGENKRHGHWVWFYEDGETMCEGDFTDGKPVGHHNWFHPSGQKEKEGDFVDGKKNGAWSEWYANGQKKSEGQYVADREAGQWYFWNEEGKVTSAPQHANPALLAGSINGEYPPSMTAQPRRVVPASQSVRRTSRPRGRSSRSTWRGPLPVGGCWHGTTGPASLADILNGRTNRR